MQRGGGGGGVRWEGGLVKGQLQAEEREGVGTVEGEGCGLSDNDAPEGGTRIGRGVFFYL